MAKYSAKGRVDVKISDFSEGDRVMVSSYSAFQWLNKAKNDAVSADLLFEAFKEREKRASDGELELGLVMSIEDVKRVFTNSEPRILCRV